MHDTVGGRKVLTKAKRWLANKPRTIFADKGYQGSKFWWWASAVAVGSLGRLPVLGV